MTQLDQFDVEPNTAYSGSYVDAIFSGSFLNGDRRIIALHSSGSNEIRLARTYSAYADFSGSNRTRSLGMGFRFRRFASPEERYEDTILPDVYQCYLLNGGQLVLAQAELGPAPILITDGDSPVVSGAVGKLVFTTHNTTASNADTSANIADTVWCNTHPFQRRYKDVPRILEQKLRKNNVYIPVSESYTLASGKGVRYGEYVSSFPSSSLTTVEFIMPRISVLGPTGSIAGFGATEPVRYTLLDVTGSTLAADELFYSFTADLYPPAAPGNFGITRGTINPSQKQLTKAIFGVGDNYQNVPIVNAVTSSKHYSTAGVVNGYYVSSVDIRGWKYGVENGFPVYSDCVFRANSFGQFRDMLEQRAYTKFYNEYGATTDGRNNERIGSLGAVVNIRFVSGSAAWVSASNPTTYNVNDSGIYDFEYKSGQPFTDI
jgi:hypothetical protein